MFIQSLYHYYKDPAPENPCVPAPYLTRSPCIYRPDSEGPCPLLRCDKNNNVCMSCDLVGNNASVRRSVDEILVLMRDNQVRYYRMQEGRYAVAASAMDPWEVKLEPRRSTNGRCVLEACGQAIDRRYCKSTGDFCGHACAALVSERLRRRHPQLLPDSGFVDPEWLYRPRGRRSMGVFSSTVCDFPECADEPRHTLKTQGLVLCTVHHTLVSRRLKSSRRRNISLTRDELLASGDNDRDCCEWPSGCGESVHRHHRLVGLDLCGRHYNRVRWRVDVIKKTGRNCTNEELLTDDHWQNQQ